MKWVLTLRATYFTAALAGALLYGAYNLVQLQRACSPDTLLVCIKQAVLPAAPKAKTIETTGQTPPPVVVRAAGQTSTAEEMLIWTGNLDGEVGRVAGSDFVKAVKAFQTSLGASPATGELSSQQYSALLNEFRNAQRKWQFQKVSDPQAAELWLPRRLLPDGERN